MDMGIFSGVFLVAWADRPNGSGDERARPAFPVPAILPVHYAAAGQSFIDQ